MTAYTSALKEGWHEMRRLAPLLAAWALAISASATAETTATTKASMDAIKASIQASFATHDISMVYVQALAVHGTAVGKSRSTGSRIDVSFTQVPGQDAKVVVTSDGPANPELERSVLDTVIGGLQK